jgi:hypothetical protein
VFVTIFRVLAGFFHMPPRPTTGPKRTALNHPVVALIAILVIVASLATLVFPKRPHSPKANVTPFAALGEILGQETSRLLGNKGDIVLVVDDSDKFQTASDQVRLDAFKKALKKAGQTTVVATENIRVKFGMRNLAMGIPADTFADIVRRHPSCDAIVSFSGSPQLKPDDIRQLPARLPKVITFSVDDVNLKQLFRADIVQLAVVPSPKQTVGAPEPRTPQEWFDNSFRIITPKNVEPLP